MTVENSKSDRGLNKLAQEVAAQNTVQASVESLLIGISQIVKNDDDFVSDEFEKGMDKNNKQLAQAVIMNTAAAKASDTTLGNMSKIPVEKRPKVTEVGEGDIDGSYGYVPPPAATGPIQTTTPGQIPSEESQRPPG